MNHSCFRVGLLHTATKLLPALSEPITVTRKSPRIAAVLEILQAFVRHHEEVPNRGKVFALLRLEDK